MITLKDIASLCNVSIATVSRALNGQTDAGNATAKRIRRIAQEMGYLPNAAARALKTNHSNNIGILYEDDIHHEYFSLMINNIKMAAEAKGYDITFLNRSKASSYYELAKYRGLDGVIILQAAFQSPEVIRLSGSDLPCVAIDYAYDSCSCVLSDNQQSMSLLIRHAYDKGHRKIAFVHGQKNGYVTIERLAGFYKACASLGITVPNEYVLEACYHDPISAANATRKLISLENRPTCILYPDDFSCLGAIAELEKAGLSVPRDIAIIGYDGIMLASVLRPKLTTYHQDVQKMGLAAVQLLTDAITKGSTNATEHIVITGQLQTGETV